ncbi:hypothetical protein CASFOL_031721 [Castilleja foliolosa]|uniref:Uncharacterized protein n=1 Tax=Castilleja foliolosa TaxID=1961234 RepID=A0ABD3C6B9_9LAMI
MPYEKTQAHNHTPSSFLRSIPSSFLRSDSKAIYKLKGYVLIAAQERQKRGESWDFGLAARGSRLGAATKSNGF